MKSRSGRSVIVILIILALLGAAGYLAYRVVTRHPAPSQAKSEQLWTCPMHPSVIRTEPGQCPICGMDLAPVEKTTTSVKSTVAGHGVVAISPEQQQLIGVVTTKVGRRILTSGFRAAGQVVVNEERLTDVHTKYDGWIEQLFANQTGQIVHRGQPLLTIYSPELVSAQEEYLIALRSRERTKESPFLEVRKSGNSLVEAARKRLRLWDIAESDIARLDRGGEVKKAVTMVSPATGYVMEKMAVKGQMVSPAMTLFRLADLSRIWVEASIYEYEAGVVQVGQPAAFQLAARPGTTYRGRVSFINPQVEEMTRTLRARLELANPGLSLKPGMWGEVIIESPRGKELAVPEETVLDSGTRQLVFVKEEEGTFVPREVILGALADGYYPVVSGLSEGEEVVSSPNFLLDSESRLQAVIQQKTKNDTGGGHAGHGR